MSKWNQIWNKLGTIVSVFLLLTALAFVEHKNARTIIDDVDVMISGSHEAQFISAQEIRQDLLNRGASLVGATLPDIDLIGLEDQLKAIPSVKDAVVYHTMDGILHADIEQRNPVVRLIDADDRGFYVDQEGWSMPLSTEYTPSVLIVKSARSEPYVGQGVQHVLDDDSTMSVSFADESYRIAKVISADPFWKHMIDHAVVDSKGQFILVPRVGGHRIRIGDHDKLANDLAKLRTFYKEGIDQSGWRRYSTIDLRFADQIVCTKK